MNTWEAGGWPRVKSKGQKGYCKVPDSCWEAPCLLRSTCRQLTAVLIVHKWTIQGCRMWIVRKVMICVITTGIRSIMWPEKWCVYLGESAKEWCIGMHKCIGMVALLNCKESWLIWGVTSKAKCLKGALMSTIKGYSDDLFQIWSRKWNRNRCENRLIVVNNKKGGNNLIYFSLPPSFTVSADYSKSCVTWSVSFQFCFFQFHTDTLLHELTSLRKERCFLSWYELLCGWWDEPQSFRTILRSP